MDVARLKEILRQQYGINSESEFNMAVEKCQGINIGLFTKPLGERSNDFEQETEMQASA